MAFKSKYKGAEIEEKLDKIEGIPSLVSEMLTSRDYVTKSDLICILKNYAPSDYSTIPIDNITIYWDRGILKSRGSGTGNGLWELRENSLGERFLYSTLPVVTKFGITTYSDEDTSDIMSDLWLNIPIDNDTIYWYTNEDGTMVLKSKGGNGGNSSELLELLSKLFKGHFDNDGNLLFIEAMADIAVNGGMTLYYDNGAGDLPTIYDGLPIDGTTITWKTIVENGESKNVIVANINENQLQDYLDKYGYVKGDINGNIDLSDYATIKYVKENYVSNNYLSEELKKYVTLSGNQDITGIKNFINGLQIGGLSIYKSKENVIYIDSDVVIKGGLTTYSDDSEDSSSILDALPIASTSSAGIAYFDSEFFTIDNTGKVSLKYTDSGGLDENQLKIYLTNNKYVTQDWVLKQDYASSNSVKLIQEELNIFLKGADTDDIINKWKELEVFLSGLSETDNLATILSNKADKEDVLDFIPNSGYTEITGEKNFVGGLKVNNGSISYNEAGYWTLEGSLLVTGGITMYGAENGSISANIMDAILTDGTTIRVNPETKQLEVIGGGTGIPINIYDGLDSTSTSTALSANQGRVLKELIDNIELGDIDLSGYLPTTGGTLKNGSERNPLILDTTDTVGAYLTFKANGTNKTYVGYDSALGSLMQDVETSTILRIKDKDAYIGSSSSGYKTILNSTNYSSYALPLTGGTVGELYVGGTSVGTGHLATMSSKARISLISFNDGNNYIESGNSDFSANTPLRITGKSAGLGSNLYLYFNKIYCRGNNYINIDSGNYSSYALPLTGGTISGTEALPITISNNINDGEFQVGIRLLNPNKTNTNGNTLGTAQFGYTKSDGVYMFNYDNYNYYNCAIGITDDGIAYVGKGGSIDTKYKIWHEGNDGSGSGLSADMLDGYHWYDFYRSYIEGINATDVNTFVKTKHTGTYSINHDYQYSGLLLSFNRGQGSVSSIELIAPHYDFHIYGLQARIAIDNNRYSALRTFAFTDSNVASATKLQTARTIWGQSFDGTGNVDGDIRSSNQTFNVYANNKEILSYSTKNKYLSLGYGTLADSFTTYLHGYNINLRYGAYGTDGLILNSVGNVGIGTTSPQAMLSVQGGIDTFRSSGDYSGAIGFNRKSSVGGLYISSYHGHQIHNYKGDLQFYIEKTDKTWLYPLVIQGSTGNVGIGTDSPSSKLDVKGGVRAQSYYGYNGNTATTSSYRWAIYQWNNELQITRRDNSNTYLSTMLGFDLESGNVGLGITTPSQKLHVNGNIYANGYENVLYSLYEQTLKYSSNSGGFRIGRFDEPLGGLKLQFGGDGSGNFSIINRDWSVAVLTLTNSGNLSVSGGITMYSDQRKKTILNHVELSLKQIADAPLIEHYYNSDESKTTHVGSIAQYWAEMNDWFCKKDNEGFYTMEIQNAALASAISIARELVKFESETDRRIRILERENKELKREVKKLKKLWQ